MCADLECLDLRRSDFSAVVTIQLGKKKPKWIVKYQPNLSKNTVERRQTGLVRILNSSLSSVFQILNDDWNPDAQLAEIWMQIETHNFVVLA